MSLFACAVLDVRATAQARSIVAALDGTLDIIDGPRLSLAVCRIEATHPDPRAMSDWIATLHAAIDVIPMQFGDRVDSAADAVELLTRRETQLLATLDAIHGRTEFGLRLYADEASVALAQRAEPTAEHEAARDGATYLRSRASHYAVLDGIPAGLSTRVQRWLVDLGVPGLRARLEGPSPLIPYPAVYMLVAREHAAQLVERCDRLSEQLACRVVLSGPWAPFNFVSGINVGG